VLPRSRTARPDDTPSVHAVARKRLGNPRGSSPVNAGALPRSCRSTTSTSEINKHKGQLFVEAVEPRAAGADRRSHGRRSPGTSVVPAQTRLFARREYAASCRAAATPIPTCTSRSRISRTTSSRHAGERSPARRRPAKPPVPAVLVGDLDHPPPGREANRHVYRPGPERNRRCRMNRES